MTYQRNPESGIWERTNARNISYSDGTESCILEIVHNARDLSVLSAELAARISDWPTEYHFSRARHALLRPFDIQPGDRVLELGCGCGALTRYLGECGAKVDAVEGNLTRAQIAAARCCDLPNVAVHLDDLSQFSTDSTYDWVLLIGVLEYAPVYSSGPDPVREYLTHAAHFLSPRGRLVIAIENKLGLKYFNGCAEDHVGRPFYGIQGLYDKKQPVTFGKKELSGLLAAVGLSSVRFYYPFPDYKLPNAILTDTAIISPNFPVAEFLSQSPSRDYTLPTSRAFSEPLVWQELHANGLLADFANSFLVVASPTPLPSPDNSVLAWRFAVNRRPDWAAQTAYLQTPNGIVENRRPLVPSGPSRSIRVRNYQITQRMGSAPLARYPFPVVDFLRVYARHGTLPPCIQVLAPWFRWLWNQSDASHINGSFFDHTPFAQSEWSLTGPIPLVWVLSRFMQNLLEQVSLPSAPAHVYEILRELFQIENLPFVFEMCDVENGLQLESEFQQQIR